MKIAAVNLRERFICVLNQSVEETVDLGGFTLQQLEHDFPVYLYRFPPGTLLAPQHHVTVCPAPPAPARARPARLTRARRRPQVWGKGSGSAKKPMPSSVGWGPRHVRSRRSLVTLLLSPKGEVGAGPAGRLGGLGGSRGGVTARPARPQLLSEHQAPHSVTPATTTLDDHTNLSIDRFPLPEAQPGDDTPEQGRPPRTPRNRRAPKARARSRWRPRWGPRVPRSPPLPQALLPKLPPDPIGPPPTSAVPPSPGRPRVIQGSPLNAPSQPCARRDRPLIAGGTGPHHPLAPPGPGPSCRT